MQRGGASDSISDDVRLAEALESSFFAHATPAVAAALGERNEDRGLGSRMATLFRAGQRAWVDLAVSPDDFATLLARSMKRAPEGPTDIEKLRGADLYLVCAYARGDPRAARVFEGECAPRALAALRRIGVDAPTREDLLQDLRERLARALTPGEASGYRGQGELVSWLCVCAVRAAGKRQARAARERSPEEALAGEGVDAHESLETTQMRRAYREHLVAALGDGLAALTVRERNLIRYRFLHGLSAEQIAGLYRVHRVTAQHWLERAAASLRAHLRAALGARLGVESSTVESLLRLVDTSLQDSLAAALPARALETE